MPGGPARSGEAVHHVLDDALLRPVRLTIGKTHEHAHLRSGGGPAQIRLFLDEQRLCAPLAAVTAAAKPAVPPADHNNIKLSFHKQLSFPSVT